MGIDKTVFANWDKPFGITNPYLHKKLKAFSAAVAPSFPLTTAASPVWILLALASPLAMSFVVHISAKGFAIFPFMVTLDIRGLSLTTSATLFVAALAASALFQKNPLPPLAITSAFLVAISFK